MTYPHSLDRSLVICAPRDVKKLTGKRSAAVAVGAAGSDDAPAAM